MISLLLLILVEGTNKAGESVLNISLVIVPSDVISQSACVKYLDVFFFSVTVAFFFLLFTSGNSVKSTSQVFT